MAFNLGPEFDKHLAIAARSSQHDELGAELYAALKTGRKQAALALIDARADVNYRWGDWTLLHWAASQSAHLDVVRYASSQAASFVHSFIERNAWSSRPAQVPDWPAGRHRLCGTPT